MLTASIVTYNNDPAVLARTINCFLNSSDNAPLYLIDNSSTSEASQFRNIPSVSYRFNNQNIGFGKGHNLAIKASIETEGYHLVLNPDVYFDKNVIPELINFMELNQDVGIVMPKILYPDGTLQLLCKHLPAPHQVLARRFLCKITSLQERINHKFEMRYCGYDKITEVPSLSGCFMLIRKSVLKEIGMFDERFFLYFEDTDFSRRVHERYKTIFYPYVQAYHVHERSHYKDFKLFVQALKSAYLYFNKWGWWNDTQRKEFNDSAFKKFRLNGYYWKLKNPVHL